ncbi:MAG: FGGY family carbohydrate kinase [[Clostridium] innocuum]
MTRRSIVYENSYGYTILQPQEGWREIDPDVWMQAVMQGLADIVDTFNQKDISVIGVTGQMHTTVFLDENKEPVRNAIMWTDLRTGRYG